MLLVCGWWVLFFNTPKNQIFKQEFLNLPASLELISIYQKKRADISSFLCILSINNLFWLKCLLKPAPNFQFPFLINCEKVWLIVSLRYPNGTQYLMATTSKTILLFCILISLFLISSAQSCSNYTFSGTKIFKSCKDLPYLQAHLHWNYIASTRKVDIAYRATPTSPGWIAWAINPTGTGMVGSEALVAFLNPNGSMTAYTTQINSYNPSMQPRALSFEVSNIRAEYSTNEMIIFAIVGPLKNGTTVNHVWQDGNSVSDNIPQMHSTSGPNIQSMEKLDFLSG